MSLFEKVTCFAIEISALIFFGSMEKLHFYGLVVIPDTKCYSMGFFSFLNGYCSNKPVPIFCNGGQVHKSSLTLFSLFYPCQHFAKYNWLKSTSVSSSLLYPDCRKVKYLPKNLKQENDGSKKDLSLRGFFAKSQSQPPNSILDQNIKQTSRITQILCDPF